MLSKDTKTNKKVSIRPLIYWGDSHAVRLVREHGELLACLPGTRIARIDRKGKTDRHGSFPGDVSHLQQGAITASIYQHPYRQGQIAVRILADKLVNDVSLPPIFHLSPGVVIACNLHLFRELRVTENHLKNPACLEERSSLSASPKGP